MLVEAPEIRWQWRHIQSEQAASKGISGVWMEIIPTIVTAHATAVTAVVRTRIATRLSTAATLSR